MRKINLELAYELALEQEKESVWNADKLNVIAHYLGREAEWEKYEGDNFESIANEMIKQVFEEHHQIKQLEMMAVKKGN